MSTASEIILDSKLYFSELIGKACNERKIETKPQVQEYLVNLLNSFVRTENLYIEKKPDGKKENFCLAELYLTAVNAEDKLKLNLLKRLGDTSLYVSGFFGDSFKRKIIDVDYYIEMGETAFSVLSDSTNMDLQSKVYKDISENFLDFVDVLTLISQKCSIQESTDVLRLYDKYLLIDSDLAKDQLLELGMLNIPKKNSSKQ